MIDTLLNKIRDTWIETLKEYNELERYFLKMKEGADYQTRKEIEFLENKVTLEFPIQYCAKLFFNKSIWD